MGRSAGRVDPGLLVDQMLGDSAHWFLGYSIAAWKSVGLRAAHLGTSN